MPNPAHEIRYFLRQLPMLARLHKYNWVLTKFHNPDCAGCYNRNGRFLGSVDLNNPYSAIPKGTHSVKMHSATIGQKQVGLFSS